MTDQLQEQQEAGRTAELIVTELVDDFVAALINTRIYWSDHARVVSSIQSVLKKLREICRVGALESLTISVTKEFLVFDERPLLGATLNASRLISSLRDWKCGGIRLSRSTNKSDLATLLTAINSRRHRAETFEKINRELERRGVDSITLLPIYQDLEGRLEEGLSEADKRRLSVPLHLYQSVMDLLQGITVSVSTGGNINFAPVEAQAEQMLRRLESDEGPLVNLARQDHYDAFTFGHSVRVSVLALNFGRALTDDMGSLIRLGTAALLHDVGKSMVPFELLQTSKPLSTEERHEICKHPEYGAQILIDHAEADPHTVAASFGHHCAHGSGGYPKTQHEHDVSLVTDIVGIVDVFEALTAARPYKRPMSPVRAYRIMMGMTDKFDPALLRRFIEVNGIFPCGQLVQLSTGEIARVTKQSEDLQAPLVRVISDREENHLDVDDRWVLDLSEQDPANAAGITRSLKDDVATLAYS